MPWRHLIFPANPVAGSTYLDPQLVIPPAAPTLPATTVATFLGTKGNTPASPTCDNSIPIIPLERLVDLFVRLACVERRIARKARIDTMLEPASFTPCAYATQDAPEAAQNDDDQNEEVLDEEILQSKISRLSLIFQGDELSDILAAAASPPPPLLRSGRGAAMVSVCSPNASVSLEALSRIANDRSPASPCAHAECFFAASCKDKYVEA
ncbi:hypothetical protein T484DRAFT_1796414 [Baffinella frigidus]|nr:hypothetical protein T484DRAFT_1796414 [Cryptophyta sp. CCMP2293]